MRVVPDLDSNPNAMSDLGQKQTRTAKIMMSALPPQADIDR
jgi:hypothetical protein